MARASQRNAANEGGIVRPDVARVVEAIAREIAREDHEAELRAAGRTVGRE